ncbi:uncharacterized protein LOC113357456 isoform X1 [Papaver somniferum]|uniref:uncharacterized protein LOC113357456 isoform X1 n=1 Tax=Papaver somniferum TaxID=3469 RepID=UPI000E6FD558|nr:uncharacterized protein LOC113357456 isoform X1 [Papaver somniferum]XP_026456633.1 uncharacterized protein LOC113357456 isoform X1 [Papaver somniferum]
MDSVKMDHDGEHLTEDTSAELLLFPRYDIFGEPEVVPRVGDQYQVEIPERERESDNFKNTASHFETAGTSHSSPMRLSIPVMWVYDQVDDIKLEGIKLQRAPDGRMGANRSERKARHKYSDHKGIKAKVEPFVKLDSRENSTLAGNRMDADLPSMNEKCDLVAKNYCPVPGLVSNSWRDVEKDRFLLGLYIFGKNLVQVKKFVESKQMGDIQSYYYGRFFRSDAHRRWSEGRKIRSKKCVHGQKIFTGLRQQELLSRLLPHVPKECRNAFMEMQVGKKLTDGTITLEDYVSMMKETVGIETLVEAVGIGKGKRDLTGISDSVRSNQAIPVRQEIPTGKECNSLTSADILKFLNGDFRLSKARSNDLFWEAVWPRLLARGWHSEQPKYQGYNNGNKNSLVFLIPDVKKFSRKRHVKGNHYFDSVTDVLDKVVSDPTLLDVEVEEAPIEDDNNEAHEWNPEMDQDIHSDHQRHCYLKPPLSSSNSDLVKFTVVDTSLINGERPFKMRDLRTLPVETNNASTPSSISGETIGVSFKERLDYPDSVDMLVDGTQQDTVTSRPRKGNSNADNLVGVSRQCVSINGSVISSFSMENHEFQYAAVNDNQHVGKMSRCILQKRAKSGESNSSVPVKKRKKIGPRAKKERSLSTNNISTHFGVKEEEPSSNLDSPDACEHMVPEVYPFQDKVSSGSSTKEDRHDSNEKLGSRRAEQRPMIDLNALPEYEDSDPFFMEEGDFHCDESTKGLSLPAEVIQPEDLQTSVRTSNGISSAEDQPTLNARRQSSRNRPLTAKALEALAGGYITTNRKSRDKKSVSRDNSFTRPSPRVRAKGCVAAGSANTKVDERVEEACSSNTDMLRESRIRSEIEGCDELMLSLSLSLKLPYHSEIFAERYNQPG